ncbi:DUF371 domain-containing protein [Candidatus Altiarchaeota archaeon]
MSEVIRARGHHNVSCKHKTTLEFTKDTHLTPQGDCILAIGADKGMNELTDDFKNSLRREGSVIEVIIECGDMREIVTAMGSQSLILSHPTDMVVRKSDFICSRTLAVRADKASHDLDRGLIEELKKEKEVKVTLRLIEK